MPEEKRTDRKKVIKGLKYLIGSLPLAFLGPSAIFSAGGNKDKSLYLVILILGLIITFLAAYCMYRGIQSIMRGIFND